MAVDHKQILDAVVGALSARRDVRSILEAGSAAFGRQDDLSDIDLVIDVEDGSQEAVFGALETGLERLSPIAARWHVPEPAWHGMSQRFYRLEGAPEHLVIDACLRPRSKRGNLSEVELHGRPRVYLDRDGSAEPLPLDRTALATKLRDRVEQLRQRMPFTAYLPGKELARGRLADAFGFYVSMNLQPLVELLRIRHCPPRHAFGFRYLDVDLPADVAARVTSLLLARDAGDLAAKHRECVAWMEEELRRLEGDPP